MMIIEFELIMSKASSTTSSKAKKSLSLPRQMIAKAKKTHITQPSESDKEKDQLIAGLKQQEQSLRSKLKDYKELKEKKTVFSKEHAQLEKETNFLRINLKNLCSTHFPQVNELKKANFQLSSSSYALDKDYNKISRSNEEASKDISSHNIEIGSLTKQIEETRNKLLREDTQVKALLNSKQQLTKELSDFSKQKNSLIEENKKLSIECKLKNNLIKDSERMKEKLIKDLVTIINEVFEVKSEIGETSRQLKESNETNYLLKEQLMHIKSQLDELRTQGNLIKEQREKERSELNKDINLNELHNDNVLELDKKINVLKCQLEHERNYQELQCGDLEKHQLENQKMRKLIRTLEQTNYDIEHDIMEMALRNNSDAFKEERYSERQEQWDNNRSSFDKEVGFHSFERDDRKVNQSANF